MFLRASLFGGFGLLILALSASVGINLADHPGILSLSIAGLALVAAIVATIAVVRITRPLGRLAQVARETMAGESSLDVPDTGRTDEVGFIARAIDALRTGAGENQALREAQRAL